MNKNLWRKTPMQQCFTAKSFGLILALSLAGCGGGGGSSNPPTIEPVTPVPTTKIFSTVSAVSAEPIGTNCNTGGARINAGLDTNSNSVLDDSEISSTQYVCNGINGTPGTNGINGTPGINGSTGVPGTNGVNGTNGSSGLSSLVSIINEPAGANCSNSGSKVNVGLDANSNGILEGSEVTSFNYVCQGNVGATGANGIDGINGTNGVNGTNGIDGTNGLNGAPGPAGTNGLVSLITITPELSGSNCANGGNRVSSGVDSNSNSILDSAEITSTTYICTPQSNSLVTTRVNADTQTLSNRSYIVDSTNPATLTLPTNPVDGDIVSFTGIGSGTWSIAQNTGQSVITKNTFGGPGWAPKISQQNWTSVSSSNDGTTMLAMSNAGFTSAMYMSQDFGKTFKSLPTPADRGTGVFTASQDGRRMAMVVNALYSNYPYVNISADGGSNWYGYLITNTTNIRPNSIAMNGDGYGIIVSIPNYYILTSSDGGYSWTGRDTVRNWKAVATSSNSSTLAAVVEGGNIYISTDYGDTFTPRESARNWTAITMSYDGTKMFAVAANDQIYTSTDSGTTWTARDSSRNWVSISAAADGVKVSAVESGGAIYNSVDSGVTWTANTQLPNKAWSAIALSGDGKSSIAGVTNEFAYSLLGMPSTTIGTAGSITAGQYDTLELQYTGNGKFIPTKYSSLFENFIIK